VYHQVFACHAACTGAAICDDVFIVAPLAEGLALAAELKRVLKQDLDLDLDVPKFNCYFPGDRINDDEHAHALFQNALQANPQLACLSGMDAGISKTGLRVAGVPIGNDEWVQKFVQAKAAAIQADVGKLDIISDGPIHYQMLRFCQNTRRAFLGRNTPAPLISDIFADVDATILEALCRKGTTNAHGEWTAVFRSFVDIKLQLPHFRAGFGFTSNASSAISAFCAASVSLMQWLGSCSHAEQNFIDLASTWAPGQNSANLDQWSAPILLALKQAHQVLLTDFGCHEWSIDSDGPAPASAVLQIEGSSPNPAANAPQSASRNVVPPLTLLPLTLLYSTQTVASNLDGNAKAPTVPAQRVITAHLMRFWPSHQYVLGDISLTRSEETLGLQSSQRFKACPTDPDDTNFGLHFPTPATDSQVQTDPSLREKVWHLNWMPLAFLASLRPKRQPTRFTGEIWVNFFCQALGAPIPLLHAHAVTCTQCACQKFVLDQYRDHVLTCKKHTGAIAGHDHVMNVSAQRARNSGLRVHINRKVATTAADSNKQGDVQAMEFGIPGYNDLVWDVSIVSHKIGSSTQHGLDGKLQLGDYLDVRARIKNNRYKRDYAARTSLSHLQSFLSLAKFILNFYVSCACWLTCRRSSTSISLGTKRTSGMSVSSGVGLAHSATIGMRLALPVHTVQPYALICRYMAPLTP